MKHYGDITQLSGYDLPVVDVIVGGSPCQDLSVAGKRAGLAGKRSGLFMEQIRIIKEMREKDGRTGRTGYLVRPRYLIWENVPGAFSSGTPKGADFAAVIEEIIKVCEPDADLHVDIPPDGWTKSGCFYSGDGSWSIAWRVHDAQFWGVPQRRKRISLVADFGGLSAPEILFERKGMSRDPQPCEPQGQGTPGGVEEGSGEPVFSIQGGGITSQNSQGSGINKDVSFSLNALDVHAVDCRNGREAEINGTLQSKESGGQSVNYANIIRENCHRD